MKIAIGLLSAIVGVAVSGRTAHAQQTQAISRLITVYTGQPSTTQAISRLTTVCANLPGDTQAVSRLATVYASPPGDTKAVSRLITEYTDQYATSTRAVSRLATAWLGYSVQNAATALRIAAGLNTATPREKQIFDVITAGTSANIVDVLDACRIAIYAMNPTWLP